MSRSSTLPFVTLLLFLGLSPNTEGAQTNENTVKVQSITLLENKTAKIKFEIHVEAPKSDVEINLENITDPKTIESTVKIEKNGKGQITRKFDKKKLKLTLSKGDYQLEYIDPTITITGPAYRVEIQQDQITSQIEGTLSGNVSVKNGTKYPWNGSTIIKFANTKQEESKIDTLSKDCATGETIDLFFEQQEILKQPAKYTVSVTDFKADKAHPSLIVDMKKVWPHNPVYSQFPGKIKISVDGKWNNLFTEKDFKTVTTNSKLPLIKLDELTVTRTETNKAIVSLDNTDLSILNGAFKVDYDYKYTTNPGPILAFQVPSEKDSHLQPGATLQVTHSTTLPSVNLLVDTQDPLDDIAPILASIHKALAIRVELIEVKDLKPSDLKKRFPDASKYPITYQPRKSPAKKTLLSQFLLNLSLLNKSTPSAPLLDRLKSIDSNAKQISSFFAPIPSQSLFQATLRRLALQGDHDADITLFRKQRSEQTKLARSFMQVYNALVLESTDIVQVRINLQASQPRTTRNNGLPNIPNLIEAQSNRLFQLESNNR
ncbi:hypothetical protein [uncultured Gimesia sp.]|uniref:hypothetical protein n=1 Tax=uncultured Gimesia sp. TaxID=1678688 RepID=UPI0030D9C4E6|tara:strand:+ start:17626 stop:19260 length:1635 start_codon:yes stop_codon:yes gene_type:complete